MNNSGEPITKCPVCRYDLTGLPKNHTCPECGFEYDESMRVWRGAYSPRWWWILIVFVVLVLTRQVRKVFRFGSFFGSGMEFNIATGLLILAIFVGQVLLARRITFVALGKNGISYKCPFWPVRVAPWQQVSFPQHERVPRLLPGRKLFLPLGCLRPEVRSIVLRSIRTCVAKT